MGGGKKNFRRHHSHSEPLGANSAAWRLSRELGLNVGECAQLLVAGAPGVGVPPPTAVATEEPKSWHRDLLTSWASRYRDKLKSAHGKVR